MEVHHHAHPSTSSGHRKKWTHYFWEFLMLFLAVFCGFLAENFREHYIEKHRANQYARSLINDLKKDTAMISRIIRQAKRGIRRTEMVAEYLMSKPTGRIRNIDLFTSEIFIYRPYTWNRTTLEQIKNSGSIRYFTNDSIIILLNAYDAFTRHMDEDFAEDQDRLSGFIEIRNKVVDLNYPLKFREAFDNDADSLSETEYFRELATNGPQLLTRNSYDLKIYANEVLTIGSNLRIRAENELPDLIQDAQNLINILKEEYHLK